MKFRMLWVSMGWVLVALVVYGSLTPSPPGPPLFVHGDKLLHGLAYGLLMGWFGQLSRAGRRPWIALALIGLGAGLELLQHLDGLRTGSMADGLANAIGVVSGWAALRTRAGTVLARLDQWIGRVVAR